MVWGGGEPLKKLEHAKREEHKRQEKGGDRELPRRKRRISGFTAKRHKKLNVERGR